MSSAPVAPNLLEALPYKPSTLREKRLIALLTIYGKVRANQTLELDGFPRRFLTKDFRACGAFIKKNFPHIRDISKGSIWHVKVDGLKEVVIDLKATVCYTKAGKPLNVKNLQYLIEYFRLKALEAVGPAKQKENWAKHYRLKEKLRDHYRKFGGEAPSR